MTELRPAIEVADQFMASTQERDRHFLVGYITADRRALVDAIVAMLREEVASWEASSASQGKKIGGLCAGQKRAADLIAQRFGGS